MPGSQSFIVAGLIEINSVQLRERQAMSEKKNSSVGLQIEAPSPIPERFNYDIEMGNLPK